MTSECWDVFVFWTVEAQGQDDGMQDCKGRMQIDMDCAWVLEEGRAGDESR